MFHSHVKDKLVTYDVHTRVHRSIIFLHICKNQYFVRQQPAFPTGSVSATIPYKHELQGQLASQEYLLHCIVYDSNRWEAERSHAA